MGMMMAMVMIMIMRVRVAVFGLGMIVVMVILSQVNVEFGAGDATLLGAADVKVITLELQIAQLLFELRRVHT